MRARDVAPAARYEPSMSQDWRESLLLAGWHRALEVTMRKPTG
jgi:hypothetical protein